MVKMSHRGVCVSDFEASNRFYREGLGFEEHQDFGVIEGPDMEKTMQLPGVRVRGKMLRHPSGPVIELLHFLHPPASGPRERKSALEYGLFHLSFYVDDIDAAAAKVRDAGGFVLDHTRVQDGDLTLLYCTDPDGVRVELMHHPDVPAGFSHSGIAVDDVEKALAYYAHLGFAAAENYVLDQGLEYLGTIMEVPGVRLRAQMMRDADGNTIELLKIFAPQPGGPRERKPLNRFGLTHLAFWDDAMEQTMEALTASGGYFVEEAHVKTPHIELQHGADLDGVRVELMRPVKVE
jgi:catechol 2,3-dioxygenase-like lactoylglutathione lyase family enzyme